MSNTKRHKTLSLIIKKIRVMHKSQELYLMLQKRLKQYIEKSSILCYRRDENNVQGLETLFYVM